MLTLYARNTVSARSDDDSDIVIHKTKSNQDDNYA